MLGLQLPHYANMSLHYSAIFHGCKNDYFQMKIFETVFLFLLKTYKIVGTSEAVLTSIHDLCFRAKIRENVYPCKPQFYYIKVGCTGV